MTREAKKSLDRLLPRLAWPGGPTDPSGAAFAELLEPHFGRLFGLLRSLYGDQYDFFYHLESILQTMALMWRARPGHLRERDEPFRRADSPVEHLGSQTVGGICYADRFAGSLAGVGDRIDYLRELGLTYLHVMPIFRCPEHENDGGYAVSSYREVDPALGTIDDLRQLAERLHEAGMVLCLDFVFNHTSDEHEWALRARRGEEQYRDYYLTFPDRTMPDAYERTLREIFPEVRRGSFTWNDEMGRWVWTTFNSYQWDLNYHNPEVFRSMAEEMLFLANCGVDVLRLDALAFTWKELGTTCENLPGAHTLIQAFNAVAQVVAPSLLFKSEAIVHPDEVVRYVSPEECQLSYNPLLMALEWESLATRETRLLAHSLKKRLDLPPGSCWVSYVRCHDDIGWTFSDEDAAELGINGHDHRRFLNDFYTGVFPGSFARGVPFQYNPETGDCRISGMCASLAGLEKAEQDEGDEELELALRRIELLYAVAFGFGGVPLIYLGDEVALKNDYSYRDKPATAGDSRWVHRPKTPWDLVGRRAEGSTVEARIFTRLKHLVAVRKAERLFSVDATQRVVDSRNPHVLAMVREVDTERLVILANFSEHEPWISGAVLRLLGEGEGFVDLISGAHHSAEESVRMAPYQVAWLKRIR